MSGDANPHRLLDLLSRQAACDRDRLGRLAGNGPPLGQLLADGLIDRVAARALLLVADGRLDESDLRQLFAGSRVRAAVDDFADPLDAPPVPPLAVGDRLGRYAVKGLLGRGGTCRVYLGVHPTLRRPVALKVPLRHDAATAARLRSEATTLARLQHRHVVRLWDCDEAGGVPFLVLDYIDGESLHQPLRRGKPLGIRRAVKAIRQAARGLRAAHRLGLTHGDVKPANLLVTLDGVVKLADFGQVRAAGRADGTWGYLAPERFDGAGDARSDIYSLGLTLYHLLAGRPAVTAAGYRAARAAHARLELEPLHWSVPGVTPALDATIRRMTAADPAARPDAAAVLAALRS